MTASTTAICPRCGEEFQQKTTGFPKKYCRPNCLDVKKDCAICGEPFIGYPEQKYCSWRPCYLEAMSRRNKADPEAQRRRLALGREKLLEYLHDKHSGRGYRKVGGRHEHRVVAEAVLGRPLAKGEVVHHEDLDKLNNFPTNLIVFPTQAQHTSHHRQDHPGNGPCDCPCIRLGDLL